MGSDTDDIAVAAVSRLWSEQGQSMGDLVGDGVQNVWRQQSALDTVDDAMNFMSMSRMADVFASGTHSTNSARAMMSGETDPVDAEVGSLRAELNPASESNARADMIDAVPEHVWAVLDVTKAVHETSLNFSVAWNSINSVRTDLMSLLRGQ